MSDAVQWLSLPAGSLFSGEVRAYVAPVDRADLLPVPFDPVTMGRFALDQPPAGWLSVGAVSNFERTPLSSPAPVRSGAPATVKTQVRPAVEEEVRFTFPGWTRIAMALSAGAQTLNLLQTSTGANSNPSGGAAAAAEALLSGSTATVLQLAAATSVKAGDVVAVDVDYTGQTGYLGAGAPGGYISVAPQNADVHAVRRVSFNVSRVSSVANGVVTLASPLPGDVPTLDMKVAVVKGFADRNGGAFLPEWSALFVVEGVQGDRMLLHYPRLQPAGGSAAEVKQQLAAGVDRWRPIAHLRALPIADGNDGVPAVCFRSYLPAAMRLV